jgi:putative peptidoglycan lipid II flippase
MGLRLPRPRLTPQVRQLMLRMLPGLVGAGVTQLNLAMDVVISSLLPPGTVSLLYYADRVQQLPLGVIGTAVGTALLPLLSRQVRAGEGEASVGTLNRAIEYALFLTLPAAVALVVSAWPVMSVLFGRGEFDPESVRLSAQSLAAYALGLPAFVLVKVVAPGFFARGDMATPVKIGVTAVVLNLAMNVVFNLGYIVSSLGFTVPAPYANWVPALAHVGPALATSVAAMFNVGCLGAVLARQGYLRPDAQLWRRSVGMLAAAGAMGLALAVAQHVLFATPLHGLARIGALAALVAVGLVVYGGAAMAFGAGDWRELGRMLARRRGRRAVTGVAADRVPRP